jgi:hypothetical protein
MLRAKAEAFVKIKESETNNIVKTTMAIQSLLNDFYQYSKTNPNVAITGDQFVQVVALVLREGKGNEAWISQKSSKA